MTEETCSWEQLVEKNRVLQETIDKLELAQAVAEQLPGSARTQTYQTPGPEVEVAKDFYCCNCHHQHYAVPCKPEDGAILGYCPTCRKQKTLIRGIYANVFSRKAQQPDSPTIDSDSD